MPEHVVSEAAQLNSIRLEENLSYLALAQMMGLSERATYRFINHPEERFYDRTLFKIRRFLESRQAPKRGKRASA